MPAGEVKHQTNAVNGPWDDDTFAENGWNLDDRLQDAMR
jgi:hypothetical protein